VTKPEIKNLPASVRQRLANIADARGEPFQRVLVEYGLERLLYRLSQSKHRDRFVLKGALLFSVWSDAPHRPTMDVDLMSAASADVAEIVAIFNAVCATQVEDDGLAFLPGSVRGEEIRETHAYAGVRIKLLAKLDNAHIDLQADVGFADVITPGPVEMDYPTLLGFRPPHLRAYPRETVVAEKLEATVSLGMQNGRMKDFYDLWALARQFEFNGDTLANAIRNTFDRRKTALPMTNPVALPEKFATDASKQKQWSSFLAKAGLEAPNLPAVGGAIEAFLSEPALAAAQWQAFHAKWMPPGPWRTQRSR
jgi:predicted nucleotidyltransferase component of viral defense system